MAEALNAGTIYVEMKMLNDKFTAAHAEDMKLIQQLEDKIQQMNGHVEKGAREAHVSMLAMQHVARALGGELGSVTVHAYHMSEEMGKMGAFLGVLLVAGVLTNKYMENQRELTKATEEHNKELANTAIHWASQASQIGIADKLEREHIAGVFEGMQKINDLRTKIAEQNQAVTHNPMALALIGLGDDSYDKQRQLLRDQVGETRAFMELDRLGVEERAVIHRQEITEDIAYAQEKAGMAEQRSSIAKKLYSIQLQSQQDDTALYRKQSDERAKAEDLFVKQSQSYSQMEVRWAADRAEKRKEITGKGGGFINNFKTDMWYGGDEKSRAKDLAKFDMETAAGSEQMQSVKEAMDLAQKKYGELDPKFAKEWELQKIKDYEKYQQEVYDRVNQNRVKSTELQIQLDTREGYARQQAVKDEERRQELQDARATGNQVLIASTEDRLDKEKQFQYLQEAEQRKNEEFSQLRKYRVGTGQESTIDAQVLEWQREQVKKTALAWEVVAKYAGQYKQQLIDIALHAGNLQLEVLKVKEAEFRGDFNDQGGAGGAAAKYAEYLQQHPTDTQAQKDQQYALLVAQQNLSDEALAQQQLLNIHNPAAQNKALQDAAAETKRLQDEGLLSGDQATMLMMHKQAEIYGKANDGTFQSGWTKGMVDLKTAGMQTQMPGFTMVDGHFRQIENLLTNLGTAGMQTLPHN